MGRRSVRMRRDGTLFQTATSSCHAPPPRPPHSRSYPPPSGRSYDLQASSRSETGAWSPVPPSRRAYTHSPPRKTKEPPCQSTSSLRTGLMGAKFSAAAFKSSLNFPQRLVELARLVHEKEIGGETRALRELGGALGRADANEPDCGAKGVKLLPCLGQRRSCLPAQGSAEVPDERQDHGAVPGAGAHQLRRGDRASALRGARGGEQGGEPVQPPHADGGRGHGDARAPRAPRAPR